MTNLLVWYDGGCPLCRREIALMQKLDRACAIDFVDVADVAIACPVDRADLLARFHARENGEIVAGAAAFAAMWRAIPTLRPLACSRATAWSWPAWSAAIVPFYASARACNSWSAASMAR